VNKWDSEDRRFRSRLKTSFAGYFIGGVLLTIVRLTLDGAAEGVGYAALCVALVIYLYVLRRRGIWRDSDSDE
jgi:hypothetical protein